MTVHEPPVDGPVLVTGAAGFVGKHVVTALLERGFEVVVVEHTTPVSANARSRCKAVLTGDCRNPAFQRSAVCGVHTVIHAAAYVPDADRHEKDTEKCFQINGLATLGFASAAVAAGVRRFIYLSTANMYVPQTRPCTEEDPVYPICHTANYFVSKLAGELYVSNVCKRGGIDFIILRIGTPYGPGEPKRKVIPTFMRQAANGQVIVVANGGSAKYNFVHIDDVAFCVSAAVTSGETGVYNVASGEHTSVADLAHAIKSLYADAGPRVRILPSSPYLPKGFPSVAIKKARETWNYAPLTLKDGLNRYRAVFSDGCIEL